MLMGKLMLTFSMPSVESGARFGILRHANVIPSSNLGTIYGSIENVY